jgi:hypothetical protein
MKFKEKYEEIDPTTVAEIIEKNGGFEKIDAKLILVFLREKYMGKRIRIYLYYDNKRVYTINVRRIDVVLTTSDIRNNNTWYLYFAEDPNNINSYKIAPGPEDKIVILQERNPIVNLEADPYGEEDWNND